MPDVWSIETQAIDAQLDAKQDIAEKGQANGYAGLDGTGKIDATQLPSIAIGENLGAVGSQAAMLALGADPGDSCQRTDFTPAQVWLCLDTPSNDIANWAAITGYVTSVNGQAGVVTLDARDVSAVALAEVLAAAEEITIDATTAAHTAHSVLAITHRSGASGLCVIDIDQNQAGFTAHAFHAHLTSGAMTAGTDSGAMLVTVDTSSSTGGHIDGLHIQRATGNGADVAGIHVGSAVDPVHQVSGAEVAATVLTYNGSYTDISAAAASGASDVQLWVANGDIVYVGHASEFDEIKCNWQVVASNAGIKPLFEFWNGSAWTEFKPIDGTKGGKKNGVISLTSADLSGWASVAVDGITKRWIRITRTAATLATPPTEDTITVVVGTLYSWDSSGDIVANSVTVTNLTATGIISGISAGDVGADPSGSAATVQSNLQNHLDDTSAAHAASSIGYTPTTGSDWVDPDPDDVGDGLDKLAGRVKTLEGASATVTTSSPLSGNGTGGSPITLPTSATPTIVSLTLSQTTGTKPLTITSTTLNDNLNADMVDGYHASKTAGANIIPVEEAGGGLKAEHTATGTATVGYVQISTGVGAVPAWGPQTVATSSGVSGGTGVEVGYTEIASMAQNDVIWVTGSGVTNDQSFVTISWDGTAATGLTHTVSYTSALEANFTQESASVGTDFRSTAAVLYNSKLSRVFLLNADGTNGASNVDDLGSNTPFHTWTANGGITHATGDGPMDLNSAWICGSGKYLQLAATSSMLWPSGTLEFWIKINSYPTNPGLVFSTTDNTVSLAISNAGTIDFYFGGASHNSTAGAVSTGSWQHIAIVKNGTTLTFYVNGVDKGSHTVAATIGSSSLATTWGYRSTGGLYLDGKMTGITFTTDVLWTSGFTSPTTAYTGGFTTTGYYILWTEANFLPLTGVGDITAITITQTEQTGTTVRWLVSFDGGVTWKDSSGSTVALANIHTSGSTAANMITYLKDTITLPSTSAILASGLKSTSAGASPAVTSVVVTYNTTVPKLKAFESDSSTFTVQTWPTVSGVSARVLKASVGTVTNVKATLRQF